MASRSLRKVFKYFLSIGTIRENYNTDASFSKCQCEILKWCPFSSTKLPKTFTCVGLLNTHPNPHDNFSLIGSGGDTLYGILGNGR
jgi:hypothetical protein